MKMHKRTYTSENDSPEDKVDLSNDTLEEITKVENVGSRPITKMELSREEGRRVGLNTDTKELILVRNHLFVISAIKHFQKELL